MNSSNQKIDNCMKNLIDFLNDMGIETIACCCGHTFYPMTIIIRHIDTGNGFDIMTNTHIPRKKKFYKKDSGGFYFIPEVCEEK